MHGRVTWYKGQSERTEAGIQGFKDMLPKIQQLPDHLGSALMVDRPASEALSIVYYRDSKSLDESRPMVAKMREQVRSTAGEQATRIEEYEITIMERSQPGTTGRWCRVITGTAAPAHLDQGVDEVNKKALPALRQQKGWRSFVGGVNRQNGAAITGTTFDSEDQLEASNSALSGLRDELAKKIQLKDAKAQVFEIVVADVAATTELRV